jgi:septum formation protein
MSSQPQQSKRKIILASQSKQRQKLMQALALDFEIQPSGIDEQAIQAKTPMQRAELIAQAKAKHVQQQQTQAIIIAADTYGLLDDKILEKPQTKQEAISMLQALSGQEFLAITGFAYLDPIAQLDVSLAKTVTVKFRDLSQVEIERYVATEPVLTWSAGFSPAYDSGLALTAFVNGSLTAFTHGLPVEELVDLLRESGVAHK